jgi:Tol biopolymer transport system component
MSYVMIASTDGSASHRLTKNGNNESHPAWSKDGKWLAIQVAQSQTLQNVYVVDVTGATEHNLTTDSLSDVTPFWQP